ncbi:MAG: diacylglycerol/lipid kinase family protein [Actinomycetota bacterium]
MRRGLLLFNPEATRVSPRTRDVIAHALSAELKLDVAETKRRHHATHLASGAAHEGYDVVVCFGGDGTLNEVINGLAGTDVALIPIPGGGTNVFARTQGLPKDPIEATSIILEHLAAGTPPHRINLGRINGRMFSFCAGAGLDAAVVKSVEESAGTRKRFGEWSFVTHALLTALKLQGRRGHLRVTAGDLVVERAHAAVVCNSRPYTYLGNHPFDVCPLADIDKGLDATVLRAIGIPSIVRIIAGTFGSGGHLRMRSVTALHDIDGLRIEADVPVPYQVDGDYAGEATELDLVSVPRALSVIA